MGTEHLFKKGNKEWERRSRHGAKKTFSSSKILLQAATEFFKWCEDNPLKEQKAVVTSNGSGAGSSVEKIKLNKMRPFTIIGFCIFCGVGETYWRVFKKQLVVNENNTQQIVDDFNSVIEFIESTIYSQKFNGAAVGLLNANLIARDLGMADKMINENINHNSVPMTKDEISEISKQLENDL